MRNKKTFWERRKTWLGWGVLLLLLLATLFPALGLAQTGPNTMNFQGRLLDSSGNPLDGVTRCLRFRICSDANCNNQRWPGSGYEYHAVTTGSGTHKAGYFSVILGDSPIPPTLLYDNDTLYLEIGVSDSSSSCSSASYITMTPRSQLGVNAYAQRSRRVRTEESDNASLVRVTNTGSGGAIRAETQSTEDNARAGYFRAAGASGQTYGVYARNDSTSNLARAGYFHANGNSGQTYGVYVCNDSTSNSAMAGYFLADGNSGQTYGVYARNNSTSDFARAGYFLADGASGRTYGVYAENDSTSDDAAAGYFYVDGDSGQTYGVYARNESSTGRGAYAIYATKVGCGSSSWCYGVYTPNKMYAAAFDTTAGDVAEYLPTDQSLEPGDVVMADPRGGGRLVRAEGAYNTAVLGLISTQPGLALGSGEYEGGDNNEGKAPLALSGRAPCKVSAENGPIRPGDLLTTSSTPGHAMRAVPVEVNGISLYQPGTTIGKALDSLDSGTGVIEILVTLQ
jgi:hypothetical protein